MVFREINYNGKKKEIRELLRDRQATKKRIIYHKNKIKHHEEKIKEIEEIKIAEIEKQLKNYLD